MKRKKDTNKSKDQQRAQTTKPVTVYWNITEIMPFWLLTCFNYDLLLLCTGLEYIRKYSGSDFWKHCLINGENKLGKQVIFEWFWSCRAPECRKQSLRLFISTLKSIFKCIKFAEEGDWCLDLFACINSITDAATLPAVAAEISLLFSNFWMPVHLLYLLHDHLKPLKTLFLNSVSMTSFPVSPVFIGWWGLYLFRHQEDAGKLSSPAWFMEPSSATETFTVPPLASATRPATSALPPHFIH